MFPALPTPCEVQPKTVDCLPISAIPSDDGDSGDPSRSGADPSPPAQDHTWREETSTCATSGSLAEGVFAAPANSSPPALHLCCLGSHRPVLGSKRRFTLLSRRLKSPCHCDNIDTSRWVRLMQIRVPRFHHLLVLLLCVVVARS